ncbi:MAG: MarR family transcriptional regulator, partial [Firmicutes bacterium]|nr:MarR family transcriptional regulator [Bacillota bacterium]
RANEVLRDYDVTNGQARILVALNRSESGVYSLRDLERAFHYSQPTISGIVSRLTNKGLVTSEPDPMDNRVRLIHLTETGQKIGKLAGDKLEAADKWLTQDLSEAESEQLMDLLRRVNEAIEK